MRITKQADVEKFVRKAFDKWAQGRGVPYRDLAVLVVSNDGYFATVYLVARFWPSIISPWYENQAQVDCRQVGSSCPSRLSHRYG